VKPGQEKTGVVLSQKETGVKGRVEWEGLAGVRRREKEESGKERGGLPRRLLCLGELFAYPISYQLSQEQ
jgi:hypothetical protein